MHEFSPLRSLFWPIHRHELKKFLPMVVLIFCFLFNYHIMRDTKDTLILSSAGAEAIPFIKFWGTLPVSLLFILAYAKLSNHLSPQRLFYTVLTPFFLFFLLFGFVFYPFREALQPNGIADAMRQGITDTFPVSMQATFLSLTEVFRNWIYALFYVLAELWGSMGVSLLFWQFANDITETEEAKRFYPRFVQLGNLAVIIAGLTVIVFSDIRHLYPSHLAWGVTLKGLMSAISLSCLIIAITYRWMNRHVLPKKAKQEKPKLSLKESFLYLIRSPYLGCIALLVICYGVSINLIEVVWKSQLKLQFPNENALNTFYGYFSMATGITTYLFITFSSQILRSLGWLPAALFTPISVLLTGSIFFTCLLFRDSLATYLPYTPLWIAVVAGMIQNILAKGTKYSLFDPTKEMAYIPLDPESKVKGKAAIEVVGSRFGKSGGGLILQAVLLFGPIIANLPLLLVFITLIILLWITTCFTLNRQYQHKLSTLA